MQYIFILGNNPKLSIAEIESVISGITITDRQELYCIGEIDGVLDCQSTLDQLGGTIKIGQLATERIGADSLTQYLTRHHQSGKITFGISYLQYKGRYFDMEVKKLLRAEGLSVRILKGEKGSVSTAAIVKNKAREFVVINSIGILEICAHQNIDEYSKRDVGRPVRDMRSGSLPPKLAQMMINLARQPLSATLLDPFCGSGTVIQEALIRGYAKIIGTDLSEKAIDDTKKNLQWLEDEYAIDMSKVKIEQHDATTLTSFITPESIDAVVTETYLGKPQHGNEREETLYKELEMLQQLYDKAFGELARIIKPGGVIVFAAPVFTRTTRTLPMESIAYRHGLSLVQPSPYRYRREGQRVERDIYIFSK